MPDAEFEKTFADLAYARLRDKAPGLLDSLVGFQLIDKNEENTHAVGVFGFKVGPELIYVPVFFLNGELKGHELMYLHSQDAFVPLDESWVNYIMNRRPHMLGKIEPKAKGDLGLREPDFDLLSRAPVTGSKYASADGLCPITTDRMHPDFVGAQAMFESDPGASQYRRVHERFDLNSFLKRADVSVGQTLVKWALDNPEFGDAIMRFYDMKELIESSRFEEKKAEPDTLSSASDTGVNDRLVKVIHREDADNLDFDLGTSDSDKEKLLRDGFLVKDERPDEGVSTLYEKDFMRALTNPTRNGLYKILTAPDETRDMLVITGPDACPAPRPWQRELWGGGRMVVVDPKTGDYVVMRKQEIWAVKSYEDEAWRDSFEKLDGQDGLSEGDRFLMVNARGEGTMPLIVVRRETDNHGNTSFECNVDDTDPQHGRVPRMTGKFPAYGGAVFNREERTNSSLGYPGYNRGQLCITLTGKKGDRITNMDRTWFVPAGYRTIKLKDSNMYGERFDDHKALSEDERKKRENEKLPMSMAFVDPQVLAEMQLKLWKTAEVQELQVISDGIEYIINSAGQQHRGLSKKAATIELITKHGLRQDKAVGVLKAATFRNSPTYHIKYAQSPTFSFPEPSGAVDAQIGVPIQYPMVNVETAKTEGRQYGDNQDMDATYRAQQAGQEAAAKGQKEVFDTSVITGLINTMDIDNEIDSYISDLMLGLDRVGRILFLYYWHYDKMKDRYGGQDMVDLEDNLRNVFENLGELTLFLKQKTIEPEMSNASAEAELSEILG
jgi:hypothetical protein